MQPGTPAPAGASGSEDPFRFGIRFVRRAGPDGSKTLEQVPLTLGDLLHPEEGDQLAVRPQHEVDCHYLASVFRSRPLGPPASWVAAEWRIDWGRPDIGCHVPDLAVFVGLSRPVDMDAGTLDLPSSGGRCLLALEVVSPDSRVNDVEHKFREYYQIGIPLYVLVDQEGLHGPRSVRGYRHTPSGYQEIPLDGRGRLFVQPVHLWLGLCESRVVCFDPVSDRELGDYNMILRNLERADRALEEADRRIQEQAQELETTILQVQETGRQRDKEARERELAERQRDKEARERELAERQRDEAERKQKAAERQREEAERKQADSERLLQQQADRLRELEALLRQAQGNPPTTP